MQWTYSLFYYFVILLFCGFVTYVYNLCRINFYCAFYFSAFTILPAIAHAAAVFGDAR